MKLLVQKTASANTKIIGYRNLKGPDFGDIEEKTDRIVSGSCDTEKAKNNVSENNELTIEKEITSNVEAISARAVRQIDERNPKLRALDEAIIQGDSTLGSL